jgi:hypothetical protein
MNFFFLVLGCLAYLMGFVVFSTAKSVIHENLGLMMFLIGTVFIVGAGIIGAINKNFSQSTNEYKTSIAKSSPRQITWPSK